MGGRKETFGITWPRAGERETRNTIQAVRELTIAPGDQMNEKQFKRLRRLLHTEYNACLRMMDMRQGPALRLTERNKRRILSLDNQRLLKKLPNGRA